MKILSSLLLLGSLALTANAQGNYQIPNSDFESWANDGSSTSELANTWHSFSTASGSLSGMSSLSPSPSKVDGYKGSAVQIRSARVVIANANGNLTTGIVNMGSMSAANSANYNYSDLDNANGCLEFAGRPDSVVFYAKFTSGGSDNGRVQIILHDEVEYRDPEISSQSGNRVGKAAVLIPASEDWVRYSGAFTYDKETPTVQYMLASMTTNPTPGGSAGDYLTVDELELIYNHSLTAISYGGFPIANFDENTLAYDLSTMEYNEDYLAYTVKGAGATAETSFDETTSLLTITVKGNNYAADETSVTTYTVQFKQPEAVTTSYASKLTVNSTSAADEPVDAVAELTAEIDGTTTFCLKNVYLTKGMPLGNIRLTNVTVDGNRYTYDGTFTFEDGDDEDAYGWLGPTYGEMPVTLDATLDESTLTAVVSATFPSSTTPYRFVFAEAVTIDPTTEIASSATAKNYTITRELPAGYSTVCMPVDVQVSGSAYQMTSAEDGVVHFTKLTATGSRTSLTANVPYLVYMQRATTLTRYYGGTIDATPQAVTYGSYTLKGNYVPEFTTQGVYVLNTADDVISFLPGSAESTLSSTEAYLTADGTADTEVHIGIDGVISAIRTAKTDGSVNTPVYNLKGIKVADSTDGLPAGIYLIKGQKFIAK